MKSAGYAGLIIAKKSERVDYFGTFWVVWFSLDGRYAAYCWT